MDMVGRNNDFLASASSVAQSHLTQSSELETRMLNLSPDGHVRE